MAEQHVKTIVEAIEARRADGRSPRAIEPVRRPNLVSQPAAGNRFLSVIFLVAANLVPVVGVLLFDWNVAELMVLFWAENVVIGVYALLKMAAISRWGVIVTGPLFLAHYGAFMAIHFMLVYYMFVRGNGAGPEPLASTALAALFVPLWPALLAMVVSHGVSFFWNFLGRREYVGRDDQAADGRAVSTHDPAAYHDHLWRLASPADGAAVAGTSSAGGAEDRDGSASAPQRACSGHANRNALKEKGRPFLAEGAASFLSSGS